MKINGILNDNSGVLLEHLGNLDALDKELVKTLISGFSVNSQMQGIGWKNKTEYVSGKGNVETAEQEWSQGRPRQTDKLARIIGRNSTLDERQLTVVEASHALTEDLKVAGLVLKLNGKQVMLIKHDLFANKSLSPHMSKKTGYKETNNYSWAMTNAFVRELQRETLKYPPVTSKKTVLSELNEATKNLINTGKGQIDSIERVNAFIKIFAIREWLKVNPEAKSLAKEPALPKLDFIVIGPDEQRAALHSTRHAARNGMVPVPKTSKQLKMPGTSYSSSSHNVYIRGLVGHLRYRLNQHKNKKAGAFESAADMLKHFIEEGYLQKLIFMDTPYNLKDNRIDFQDLMLGPKGREQSYIEYVSERQHDWDDPRHKAVSSDYKELRTSMIGHAPPPPAWVQAKIEKAETEEAKMKGLQEWQEAWAYDAAKPKMAELYMKHKVEPSKILVKLVLDGGKIVPHHFEMKYERF